MNEERKISDGKTVLNMEEGLRQEKRKCTEKCDYLKNGTKRWMRYIKVILCLELALFLGWCIYTIIITYPYNEMANDSQLTVTRERFLQKFKSQPEEQPGPEMPVVFVKPELILDKLNNLLEDMELDKKQDLTQDIAAVADGIVYTNTHRPVNMREENNVVQTNDIDSLPEIVVATDLIRDGKFIKSLMPWKTKELEIPEYINKPRNVNPNEELINYPLFLEKLKSRDFPEIKAVNEIEKSENKGDFTKDANRPILKFQDSFTLDTSGKFEPSGLDISDLKDSRNQKTNKPQDSKRRSFDFVEDAQDDERLFINGNGEYVYINLQSEPAMDYPPYESQESSDASKYFVKNFLIPHILTAQVISEQIENGVSNILKAIAARNGDKHDVDDSNMSMSTSPDTNAFNSDTPRFSFDKPMTRMQTKEDQHSLNIIPSKEDEEYGSDSVKNLLERFFSQSTIDDKKEFPAPDFNGFEWFVPPAHLADNLPQGAKDAPESDKNPFSSNESKRDDLNPLFDKFKLETATPNYSGSPGLYQFLLRNMHDPFEHDYLNDSHNYYANDEDGTFEQLGKSIFDESSEIKVTPRQTALEIINTAELENISNAEVSNDIPLDLSKIINWKSIAGSTEDHQRSYEFKDMPESDKNLFSSHENILDKLDKFELEVSKLNYSAGSPELYEFLTRYWNISSEENSDVSDDYHGHYDGTFERSDESISSGSSEIKANPQPKSPGYSEAIAKLRKTMNAEVSDVLPLNLPEIDPSESTEDYQNTVQYGIPSNTKSNSDFESDTIDHEKESVSTSNISDIQIEEEQKSKQVQPEIIERQNFEDAMTSVETNEDLRKLKEEIASTFKKEITDQMRKYDYNPFKSWHNYLNKVCGPYRHSTLLHKWCLQYVNVFFSIGHQGINYDSDDVNYYRKKRMVNNLNMRQEEHATNVLEENNNSDVSWDTIKQKQNNEKKNKLNKSSLKMEVSAARSNKLHEQYFRPNKFDDYARSKFLAALRNAENINI